MDSIKVLNVIRSITQEEIRYSKIEDLTQCIRKDLIFKIAEKLEEDNLVEIKEKANYITKGIDLEERVVIMSYERFEKLRALEKAMSNYLKR